MPLRGAAELESVLMSRLYHLTNNVVSGDRVKERLEAILEVSLKSNLVELVGSNQIPQSLVKEELDRWSQRMAEIGVFGSSIEVNRTPQIVLGLRNMTEAIFRDYTPPRVPISPFVQPGVGFKGLRARQVIQDEKLSLELEERGLKEMLVPGTINKEGRRRIGASVQQALADAEMQRLRQLEEQKKLDEEKKQLEDTGFGRKVEF
jgi:hypothetical protein